MEILSALESNSSRLKSEGTGLLLCFEECCVSNYFELLAYFFTHSSAVSVSASQPRSVGSISARSDIGYSGKRLICEVGGLRVTYV